jgi:hypothetical protein
MSINVWQGLASAVSQQGNVTVTGYDPSTTYSVLIGGQAVSILGSGGSTTSTATALQVALAASTIPYFAALTWTNPSAGVVQATAKVAGVPFSLTTAVSGGGGTIGSYSPVTSSSGPNDWSTAANWSLGTVPISGEQVFLQASTVPILWGLAQAGVVLAQLTQMANFSAPVGLNSRVFATSSDGTAYVTTAPEYRQCYLQIASTAVIELGQDSGLLGSTQGCPRFMLDTGVAANQSIEILSTATASSEQNLPAIRLKADSPSYNLYVRSAPAGVGIACDQPSETATIQGVYCSDNSSSSQIVLGPGTTLDSWYQTGGNNSLQAAAAVADVSVQGGTLYIEGPITVTAASIYGGVFFPNNVGSPAYSTLTLYGGTTDFTQSSRARTVTSLVFPEGSTATLKADESVLTTSGTTWPGKQYSISLRGS